MSLDELVEKVAGRLRTSSQTLAVAESCTGGAIAATLTSRAGSSAWFERGFVVYSHAAKTDMLGVNATTADQFGSVSERVVQEMVQGALQRSQASIALAVTGVAGPSGGSVQKPVGTVWFAWAGRQLATVTCMYLFDGDRQRIREQCIKTALTGILSIFDQLGCR